MKLESFKDKKVTRRKMVLISLGAITIVGVSLLLYKTFASFSEEVSFPMMSGKVNYYGNADIIFAFYKGDQELDEMPQKGNSENLVFDYGTCDNGATIEWNEEKWAPLVKGLNKTKTRCSLYFKEYKIPTLRQVTSTDEAGMWQYKDRLTKIVIENEKSKKEYTAEQNAYGPFDESSTKDRAVESYVVYNFTNKTWTGYLQGEGGVKLNSNSSYLFYGFTTLTEIDGIENLDTSSVTNMSYMFYNMSQLQTLDLNHFDTSSVTDMSYMFGANNYNNSMKKIQTLDLSHFDTSSVTNMSYMFNHATYLKNIIYGPNFIHKAEALTNSMFNGCPANRPDATVHSSWEGVTF